VYLFITVKKLRFKKKLKRIITCDVA